MNIVDTNSLYSYSEKNKQPAKTPTMFEKNKVYDFKVSRVANYNGELYFILSYNGKETIPGYEDDEWVFRTKVLPFQESWEPSDLKNKSMPCYVQRFSVDIAGRTTDFPVLAQDIQSILKEKYQAGQCYHFTVSALPGEIGRRGEPLPTYQVTDECGFRHFLNADGVNYRKGENLQLRVRSIEGNHLEFEQPLLSRLPDHFNVGETYDFEICDEGSTSGGRSYFIVKDAILGLMHRFYPQDEREESSGDTLSLRIKGFTDKGWMVLEDPSDSMDAGEFNHISRLEDEGTLGQEGPQLEYKCSFVYTRNGELDIDHQLGYELMRHVAGFMNADGGLLCIGYYDDGTIRGINDDLKYINTGNEDEYHYELTEDKIKLKFINTIVNHLGRLAGTRVRIDLQQNSKGRMVCFIHVSPSPRPVWLNGKDLFVRCFNSVRLLRGPEITDYICERCGITMPPAELSTVPTAEVKLPPTAEAMQPLSVGNKLLSDFIPLTAEAAPVWRHISLYRDGSVSQQKQAASTADVLLNIPVSTAFKKKTSRLLLCYSNGCVNVLNPKDIIDNKLTKQENRYSNGFNNDEGVRLLSAFVCNAEDYLVIRSRKADGREMLKAVCIESYRVHKALSMNTRGNVFVKEELAQPQSFHLVPAEHNSFIYKIISRSADKYGPGHATDSHLCAEALAYLERSKYSTNANR